MRIAINALFLQLPETGSGQHLFHLLRGLDASSSAHEYMLLCPQFGSSGANQLPPLSSRFTLQKMTSPVRRFGASADSLWWEQAGVAHGVRAAQAALLHNPYFTAPLLLPAPTVVTVHDVIPLVMAEYRVKLKSRLYFRLVALAVRRATAVITVSNHAKHDIMRVLGIPEQRIHVIGNAVDESYTPVTQRPTLNAVRERYGIAEEYLLYFGGFDVRKNVPRVLEAYAALPATVRARFQLVIAGRLHRGGQPTYTNPLPIIRRLGLTNQVVVTDTVAEQDKPALYSAAALYLFPSLYEGFGIPVLEAMACGAAVITSNTTSLPEVAGDGALYVDPYDTASITRAIEQLLEDATMRVDLQAKARERARQFSWAHVAEQTLGVYESLAS